MRWNRLSFFYHNLRTRRYQKEETDQLLLQDILSQVIRQENSAIPIWIHLSNSTGDRFINTHYIGWFGGPPAWKIPKSLTTWKGNMLCFLYSFPNHRLFPVIIHWTSDLVGPVIWTPYRLSYILKPFPLTKWRNWWSDDFFSRTRVISTNNSCWLLNTLWRNLFSYSLRNIILLGSTPGTLVELLVVVSTDRCPA